MLGFLQFSFFLQAVNMSGGVTDEASESHATSEIKNREAAARMQDVKQDLRPQLERAEANVGILRDLNQYTNETLAFIDKWGSV